ncbi:MAG: tail protein [Phage 64_12]|nr:MAG: tail protein [Phage 64_12]
MAAALTVYAHDGETVDGLVDRALGKTSGAVESVLEANPGLAALGLFLPHGTAVLLPIAAQVADETPIIQLWD